MPGFAGHIDSGYVWPAIRLAKTESEQVF